MPKVSNNVYWILQVELASPSSPQCSICKKKFKRLASVREHIEHIHLNQFNYYCDICGKGLRRKTEVKEHMSSSHSGQGLYKCPTCSARLYYKRSYYAHIRRCNPQQTWGNEISVEFRTCTRLFTALFSFVIS